MSEGGPPAGATGLGRVLRSLPRAVWFGLVLAFLAILLPWNSLLDWSASRFNTVRGFYTDYARGIAWLRLALGANAALLVAWPGLLRLLWPPVSSPLARPHDRRDGEIMAGLFIVALVLRLVGVTRSLQHDEWYIATQYVQHGPLVIATRFTGYTNHVFYTLMAWVTTKLFGLNEFGLRVPAVLFGALASPILYGALRCRFARSWSLTGALALCFSAFAIEYAQEARAYSVTLFGVAALMWLFEELRDRPTRGALFGVVAVSTALVYTRIFNVLIVVAFVVAAGVNAMARKESGLALLRRSFLAAMTAAFLSFALYAITFGTFLDVLKSGRPEPGELQGYVSADILLPGELSVAFLPRGFMLAVWALSILGLIALYPRHGFWFFLLSITASLTVWRAGLPWDSSRFLMHLLPLLMTSQVAAIAWMAERGAWGRRSALMLAGALVCAQAASSVRYYQQRKLDFKAEAAFLAAQPGNGKVGYAHDSKTITWYFRPAERCVEVNEKTIDAEDPEWVSVHTATLAGEGRFANRIYRRYEQAWQQKTMYGRSLTLWHRTGPPPREK